MPEATNAAETLHRHGTDAGEWDDQPTVTERPNDTPLRGEDTPAVPNSTFGTRAKSATTAVESDDAENKAVGRRRAGTKRK